MTAEHREARSEAEMLHSQLQALEASKVSQLQALEASKVSLETELEEQLEEQGAQKALGNGAAPLLLVLCCTTAALQNALVIVLHHAENEKIALENKLVNLLGLQEPASAGAEQGIADGAGEERVTPAANSKLLGSAFSRCKQFIRSLLPLAAECPLSPFFQRNCVVQVAIKCRVRVIAKAIASTWNRAPPPAILLRVCCSW